MSNYGSLRIRARCECGAGFDGTSNPPDVIERIHAAWLAMHQGEGHRLLRPGERRPRAKTALVIEVPA